MTDRTDCPIGYGNATGYTGHGCRCVPCTAAQAAAQRRYRQRTGNEGARIQKEAQRLALELLRENTPDVYQEVLDQATQTVRGGPRRWRRP